MGDAKNPMKSFAKAMHAFVPETRVEIPLEIGDILLVISKHDSGWWKGKVISTEGHNKLGVAGYFPASYCVSAEPPSKKVPFGLVAERMARPSRASPRPTVRSGAKTVGSWRRKESGVTVDIGRVTDGKTNSGMDSRKVSAKTKTKFNSTTSMMTVDSTISKPNKKASIQGISKMIFGLVSKGSKYRSKFDEDEKQSLFESHKWKHQVKPGQEPTEQSISEFIRLVFEEAQLEVDCIITSYLYVEKIVKCGLPLTRRNIRSVVFIAMLLASKVWDDMSMWNVDFAGIFAALTLSRINDWEGAFLTGIQFNVVVKASEYTAMYFKIREYHHQAKLQMAPLRKERAQRLEALSETALKKLKIKSASKKNRSQTLGCTDMPSSQAILS